MARDPGLKALELFEAIARGKIKALWVMATNPAVSLPRAGAVREALRKLDLLVISDNVAGNDTIAFTRAVAGVVLDLQATQAAAVTVADGQGGTDLVSGFEHATGGAGNDSFIGTSGANTLVGGAGADTLAGAAGADLGFYTSMDAVIGGVPASPTFQTSADLTVAAPAVTITIKK